MLSIHDTNDLKKYNNCLLQASRMAFATQDQIVVHNWFQSKYQCQFPACIMKQYRKEKAGRQAMS